MYVYIIIFKFIHARSQKRGHCVPQLQFLLPGRRVKCHIMCKKTFHDPTDETVSQRLSFGVFFYILYIDSYICTHFVFIFFLRRPPL